MQVFSCVECGTEEGIIAFASSSGGVLCNTCARGRKGTEFEGGMRVPFIIAWAKPNKKNRFQKQWPITAGTIQTQMGTVMDIYPTLAHLSGADIPSSHPIDGQDLSMLYSGSRDSSRENCFLMQCLSHLT